MAPSPSTSRVPFGNPLANALVAVVGVLAVAASLVLGFVAFVLLGALVLVLASVIGIRLWWFGRKLKAQRPPDGPTPRPPHTADVIEGEFRVLDQADARRGPRKS